jgi:hypothetical protein
MAPLSELYRRFGRTGLTALGLLLIGLLGLVHAAVNRGTLSMDCSRFLTEKPNGKWINLSGCIVSRILSVPKTTSGDSPTQVYVPIRAEGAKPDREIRLLFVSDHPSDLEFVKRAHEQSSTSAGRGMFRSSYGGGLEETRAIEGRVLRGLDLPDRDRAKLGKTFPTLSQDFVIIESRPRPGFAFPFTFLLMGCAVGGFGIYGQLKHRLRLRFGFEMPAVAK